MKCQHVGSQWFEAESFPPMISEIRRGMPLSDVRSFGALGAMSLLQQWLRIAISAYSSSDDVSVDTHTNVLPFRVEQSRHVISPCQTMNGTKIRS